MPTQKDGKFEMNNEEVHHLLNKISSDEQKELTDIMKNCTTEVLTTRAIPFTAVVLGSLYFARTRLPAQYHFGPKGWPFYAIMGIGSMTAVNVFSMGTCRDRIQPKIKQLWEKYQETDGARSTTYDDIRSRHRQGLAPQSNIPESQSSMSGGYGSDHRGGVSSYPTMPDSGLEFTSYSGNQQPVSSGEFRDDFGEPVTRRPLPSYVYDQPSAGFMSGTPSGSRDPTGSSFQ